MCIHNYYNHFSEVSKHENLTSIRKTQVQSLARTQIFFFIFMTVDMYYYLLYRLTSGYMCMVSHNVFVYTLYVRALVPLAYILIIYIT